MILGIITTHISTIIDKLLEFIEYDSKGMTQTKLVGFCKEICGEREQQCLSFAIENYLADCLHFERACLLNYERDQLFALKYGKNEFGEICLENPIILPMTLGITGKSLLERTMITSNYGQSDIIFNPQVDNVLRLTHIENIMVIPLLVEHSKGKKNSKSSEYDNRELVGVIQLMNFKLGDVNKANKV